MANPINNHTKYTIENLPTGFTYFPETRQIYCHAFQSYSTLNPDDSVTSPKSRYYGIDPYVFMHQCAMRRKAETDAKIMEAVQPKKKYTEIKCFSQKIDLIWLIAFTAGFIITCILTPVLCNYLL